MESEKILVINQKLEEIRNEKIVLSKIHTLINNMYTLVMLTETNLEKLTNEMNSIVPDNYRINILDGENSKNKNSDTSYIINKEDVYDPASRTCPNIICASCIDDIFFDRSIKLTKILEWDNEFKGLSKCPHCQFLLLKLF